MSDEISTMLDDEIKAELNNLAMLEDGSEEKAKAVEHLQKLYKLKLEGERVVSEDDDKFINRELKKTELKTQVASQGLRIIADIGMFVGGMIFYNRCFNKGLKFEETGTFVSPTFKGFMSRIRPTNPFK